jgi:hypothetical protein
MAGSSRSSKVNTKNSSKGATVSKKTAAKKSAPSKSAASSKKTENIRDTANNDRARPGMAVTPRANGRYQCNVRRDGKQEYLGTFASKADAAKAYDIMYSGVKGKVTTFTNGRSSQNIPKAFKAVKVISSKKVVKMESESEEEEEEETSVKGRGKSTASVKKHVYNGRTWKPEHRVERMRITPRASGRIQAYASKDGGTAVYIGSFACREEAELHFHCVLKWKGDGGRKIPETKENVKKNNHSGKDVVVVKSTRTPVKISAPKNSSSNKKNNIRPDTGEPYHNVYTDKRDPDRHAARARYKGIRYYLGVFSDKDEAQAAVDEVEKYGPNRKSGTGKSSTSATSKISVSRSKKVDPPKEYHNVYEDKRAKGHWSARASYNGVRHYLGVFDNKDKAQAAVDAVEKNGLGRNFKRSVFGDSNKSDSINVKEEGRPVRSEEEKKTASNTKAASSSDRASSKGSSSKSESSKKLLHGVLPDTRQRGKFAANAVYKGESYYLGVFPNKSDAQMAVDFLADHGPPPELLKRKNDSKLGKSSAAVKAKESGLTRTSSSTSSSSSSSSQSASTTPRKYNNIYQEPRHGGKWSARGRYSGVRYYLGVFEDKDMAQDAVDDLEKHGPRSYGVQTLGRVGPNKNPKSTAKVAVAAAAAAAETKLAKKSTKMKTSSSSNASTTISLEMHGVYNDKKAGGFSAQARYKGSRYYLGNFKNKDDAFAAVLKLETGGPIGRGSQVEHFANVTAKSIKDIIAASKYNIEDSSDEEYQTPNKSQGKKGITESIATSRTSRNISATDKNRAAVKSEVKRSTAVKATKSEVKHKAPKIVSSPIRNKGSQSKSKMVPFSPTDDIEIEFF